MAEQNLMAESSQAMIQLRKVSYQKGDEDKRLVNSHSTFSYVTKVKEILTESLFTKLEATFLGPIIKAALLREGGAHIGCGLGFSGQMVHFLISRHIVTTREDELLFYFKNQPMRFSLREFHLVTGLPCWEAEVEDPAEKELEVDWPLLVKNHKMKDLIAQLQILGEDAEESKLRLAMLIVVASIFLLPYGVNKYNFLKNYLDVAAKGNIHTYPWGKESFDLMVQSVKNLKSLVKPDLKGFPMALQLWMLTSVPALEDDFARPGDASYFFPLCARYIFTYQPSHSKIWSKEKEDVKVISVLSYYNEEEGDDDLVRLLKRRYVVTELDWKRGYVLAQECISQHQEDHEVETGDYASPRLEACVSPRLEACVSPRFETPTHHLSASLHDRSDAYVDADADNADVDEIGDYAEAPTDHLCRDASLSALKHMGTGSGFK